MPHIQTQTINYIAEDDYRQQIIKLMDYVTNQHNIILDKNKELIKKNNELYQRGLTINGLLAELEEMYQKYHEILEKSKY